MASWATPLVSAFALTADDVVDSSKSLALGCLDMYVDLIGQCLVDKRTLASCPADHQSSIKEDIVFSQHIIYTNGSLKDTEMKPNKYLHPGYFRFPFAVETQEQSPSSLHGVHALIRYHIQATLENCYGETRVSKQRVFLVQPLNLQNIENAKVNVQTRLTVPVFQFCMVYTGCIRARLRLDRQGFVLKSYIPVCGEIRNNSLLRVGKVELKFLQAFHVLPQREVISASQWPESLTGEKTLWLRCLGPVSRGGRLLFHEDIPVENTLPSGKVWSGIHVQHAVVVRLMLENRAPLDMETVVIVGTSPCSPNKHPDPEYITSTMTIRCDCFCSRCSDSQDRDDPKLKEQTDILLEDLAEKNPRRSMYGCLCCRRRNKINLGRRVTSTVDTAVINSGTTLRVSRFTEPTVSMMTIRSPIRSDNLSKADISDAESKPDTDDMDVPRPPRRQRASSLPMDTSRLVEDKKGTWSSHEPVFRHTGPFVTFSQSDPASAVSQPRLTLKPPMGLLEVPLQRERERTSFGSIRKTSPLPTALASKLKGAASRERSMSSIVKDDSSTPMGECSLVLEIDPPSSEGRKMP